METRYVDDEGSEGPAASRIRRVRKGYTLQGTTGVVYTYVLRVIGSHAHSRTTAACGAWRPGVSTRVDDQPAASRA